MVSLLCSLFLTTDVFEVGRTPHIRVLSRLGRYLGIVREGRVDVLDLELALNIASLVHEVERAQRLDRHERLAALSGRLERELGALFGEVLVACEVLSIDQRDSVVRCHLHPFVGAL